MSRRRRQCPRLCKSKQAKGSSKQSVLQKTPSLRCTKHSKDCYETLSMSRTEQDCPAFRATRLALSPLKLSCPSSNSSWSNSIYKSKTTKCSAPFSSSGPTLQSASPQAPFFSPTTKRLDKTLTRGCRHGSASHRPREKRTQPFSHSSTNSFAFFSRSMDT